MASRRNHRRRATTPDATDPQHLDASSFGVSRFSAQGKHFLSRAVSTGTKIVEFYHFPVFTGNSAALRAFSPSESTIEPRGSPVRADFSRWKSLGVARRALRRRVEIDTIFTPAFRLARSPAPREIRVSRITVMRTRRGGGARLAGKRQNDGKAMAKRWQSARQIIGMQPGGTFTTRFELLARFEFHK